MAPPLGRRTGPRRIALAADLAPATRWNPLLSGDAGPATDAFSRSRDDAPLPASEGDIAVAPVTRLSRWLGRKQLSVERLTAIYLRRIGQLDSRLRSVITPTKDAALAQARKADAEMSAGHYRAPLHGIPYGVKDL